MQKSICASRVTWASGGSWLTRLPSVISLSLNHFVQSADAPARIGYWFGQCTSTDRNMRHKCIPQAIHFVPARQNWCKLAPLGHAFDSCFAGWNLTACCSMPCWRGKTDSPRCYDEYVTVWGRVVRVESVNWNGMQNNVWYKTCNGNGGRNRRWQNM